MKLTIAKTDIEKQASRDVGSRWTATLAKNGWTPVVDDFLKYYSTLFPEITNVEAMLVIQLMSWKWGDDKPFPGYKTIASRMGISDTQARSHARSLSGKGYLRRIKRKGTTNRFDLAPLFEALEKEAKKHPIKVAKEEVEEVW